MMVWLLAKERVLPVHMGEEEELKTISTEFHQVVAAMDGLKSTGLAVLGSGSSIVSTAAGGDGRSCIPELTSE